MVEHPFLQTFRQYWQLHFAALIPSETELIVAVSGGVDSVVLAYVLQHVGFNFTIAHCNFHLRGEESNRDEQFVLDFSKKIGKHIVCKDFDTIGFAKENKLSIEEAARILRYKWFRQLAEVNKTGENVLPIFVAHHANDNIETVLMNFFRGCGIAGLHGILPVKDGIFRPLLFAKRNEIVAFALSQNLQWIEDSSNRDEKYTRNFLRNNIIPELKEHFPIVENNILENIARFKDVETIYNNYIESLKKEILQKNEQDYQLDIARLQKQPALSTVVYELFKDFGFSSSQTSEILKLLDAQVGARLESEAYTVWKDRDILIISENRKISEDVIVWNENDNEIELPDGTILFNNIADVGVKNTVSLDYEKLHFPLVVRHWREGDCFYPSGMNGKKKLAKFFIDLKIPNPIKQKIWIVCSDEDIVWIVGYRADQRFVSKENTKQKIKLSFRQPE